MPDVVPPQVQPADELEYRLRQQALLAELGRRALAADNVDELLQAVLTPAQLSMLLEGIDWRAPRRTWAPQAAG